MAPLAVEETIVVQPKGYDVTIHGRLDLEDLRPSGQRGLRDLKTAEKRPPADSAERSQQLTMYALLFSAKHSGLLPESVALDTLVRTPEKHETAVVVQEARRDREDLQALLNRIATAVAAVKTGSFIPTNPENWWCSVRWCGYFQTCPYVKRVRPTT